LDFSLERLKGLGPTAVRPVGPWLVAVPRVPGPESEGERDSFLGGSGAMAVSTLLTGSCGIPLATSRRL